MLGTPTKTRTETCPGLIFSPLDSVAGTKPLEYKGPGRTWYIYKVSR